MSNQNSDCEKIIQQLLQVQAQVTVTPLVRHGTPKVYCINSDINPNCCSNECYECDNCCDNQCCNCYNYEQYNYNSCNCCSCCDGNSNYYTTCKSRKSKDKYNFVLTQVICVEIPIAIDADVDVEKTMVCCEKPDFEST